MTERSEEPRTRVASFVEECGRRARHAARGPGVWPSVGTNGRFAVGRLVGEG